MEYWTYQNLSRKGLHSMQEGLFSLYQERKWKANHHSSVCWWPISNRNKKGTILNQRKYVLDILRSTGTEDYKPTKCPFPKGFKLSVDQREVLDYLEIYRRIIGKLLYLNMTRPDISYSVQQLSQFLQEPRKPHLHAAMHVVKYLVGTSEWGLYYPKQDELSLRILWFWLGMLSIHSKVSYRILHIFCKLSDILENQETEDSIKIFHWGRI